jgi:chromosome segregation ATPase
VQEITHTPLKPRKETARRPAGVQAEVDALKAHVQTLMAEVERLTALAGTHRADLERERVHAEKVAAEFAGLIDKLAEMEKWRAEKDAELARARSQADAAGALVVEWRSRPWWRRALR